MPEGGAPGHLRFPTKMKTGRDISIAGEVRTYFDEYREISQWRQSNLFGTTQGGSTLIRYIVM